VGLRSHYVASCLVAEQMVKQKSGLIVNVSSVGGSRYLFNVRSIGAWLHGSDDLIGQGMTRHHHHHHRRCVLGCCAVQVAYGVGKAAGERMAADMARDLKKHNVTAVSLRPGTYARA
jgi:dehydrogenase/reductase SDR family protein 1